MKWQVFLWLGFVFLCTGCSAAQKTSENFSPEPETSDQKADGILTTEVSASEAIQTVTEPLSELNSENLSKTVQASESISPETLSLLGIWQYEDYPKSLVEFQESGRMILWQDYSEVMEIHDGQFLFGGEFELYALPLEIDGDHVRAIDLEEDEVVLDMYAEPGTNAASLVGEYHLADCSVYQVIADTADTELLLRSDGSVIWLGITADYVQTENAVTIKNANETFTNTITWQADTLLMRDTDGNTDTLRRIE